MRLRAIDPATVLTVNEVFGPTFQGEGPFVGQNAMFVRLFGCSLRCRWCDTAWTWTRLGSSWPPSSTRSACRHPGSAASTPAATGCDHGREPLQQQALVTLCDGIRAAGIAPAVQVVDIGHRAAASCPHRCRVDVLRLAELANSGMRCHQRIRPRVLRQFASSGKAVFKFVACGPGDLDEIAEITTSYGLAPVWVMPEGTSSTLVLARMRELAGPVAERGWNLTARLQVLLWEDERGR